MLQLLQRKWTSDQLNATRSNAPWLAEFIARGWGLLLIEMPCFGSRANRAEGATSMARLLQGRTLFGQMLGEQRAA